MASSYCDLFGIGKKTTEKLLKLNIQTIGDLANSSSSKLYQYFKNQAIVMIGWANWNDDSEVVSEEQYLKVLAMNNFRNRYIGSNQN